MTSSHYNYMIEDFTQIRKCSELKDFLFSSQDSGLKLPDNIVKYMKIGSLTKTLESGKLYVGNPQKMNDQKEVEDFPFVSWDRIFHSCFIASGEESIAMWSLYGRPWSDALSITIKGNDLIKWIRSNPMVYYKDGEEFHEIRDARLSIVKVAYTNEASINNTEPVIITCLGQRNRHIRVFGRSIEDCDDRFDKRALAGAIKDIAWSYENEIRIRCDLIGDLIPDNVYIDIPDYVFNNMIITAGPMFYGSLEQRLGAMWHDPNRLKYSNFSHLLKDMPCTDYLVCLGQNEDCCKTQNCCKEMNALKSAKSAVASADGLSLRALGGMGVFRFQSRGTLTLGEGEYLFPIHWEREGNGIKLQHRIGKYDYDANIPPVSTLAYYNFSLSESTVLPDGISVIIVNELGRVLAIRLRTESFDENLYEMEYKIYQGVRFEFFTAEYKIDEIDYSLAEDLSDPLCGTWWDENSKRATMRIGKVRDKYYVAIHWSSSATINTEWTMSGLWNLEWNGMLCSDEKCVTTTYREDGTAQKVTQYENGKSKLILMANELLWEDAQKETGYRCRFAK